MEVGRLLDLDHFVYPGRMTGRGYLSRLMGISCSRIFRDDQCEYVERLMTFGVSSLLVSNNAVKLLTLLFRSTNTLNIVVDKITIERRWEFQDSRGANRLVSSIALLEPSL